MGGGVVLLLLWLEFKDWCVQASSGEESRLVCGSDFALG